MACERATPEINALFQKFDNRKGCVGHQVIMRDAVSDRRRHEARPLKKK